MSKKTVTEPIPFSPAFQHKATTGAFLRVAISLPSLEAHDDPIRYADLRRAEWASASAGIDTRDQAAWDAAVALLLDFWLQGWRVIVSEQCVSLHRPEAIAGEDERLRRRMQLSVKRTDQLAKDSVRRFVEKMELPGAGFGSMTIRDLVTDGESLADALEHAGERDDLPVQPILEPVVSGERCRHSGLLLTDIWRYFRHTWTSPYESVPGRSLLLLVRDQARQNHPVIGIAALSSAAVKQRRRDQYIGWTLEGATSLVEQQPRRRWRGWVEKTLRLLWNETYIEDLLRDSLLASRDIDRLHSADIDRLRDEAQRCRQTHQAEPMRREFPSDDGGCEDDWLARAATPLFRSKRCEKLAMLLDLWIYHTRLLDPANSRYATRLTSSADGKRLLEQLVRLIKGRLVGTAIADLSVCGAIAPYNEIVGGKLVALLAVSESARAAYRSRYEAQTSVIASSIAGRSVVRPADLVFVGTSSLYGIRPNQYDSLSMPVSDGRSEGGRIRFKHLGKSEGYGSAHIRQRTKADLQRFMEADGRPGWRANNIFGEGANPNMRALREAFGVLGLDANELLQHSQPREMYGAALASNMTAYLLGLDRQPEYIKRRYSRGSDTEAVADFWWQRWGQRRASDPTILARIRQHSLAYPVRHGAVLSPPRSDSPTASMFADL